MTHEQRMNKSIISARQKLQSFKAEIEMLSQARGWIEDCIEYRVTHWSNEAIIRYVERHFDGGLSHFSETCYAYRDGSPVEL